MRTDLERHRMHKGKSHSNHRRCILIVLAISNDALRAHVVKAGSGWAQGSAVALSNDLESPTIWRIEVQERVAWLSIEAVWQACSNLCFQVGVDRTTLRAKGMTDMIVRQAVKAPH